MTNGRQNVKFYENFLERDLIVSRCEKLLTFQDYICNFHRYHYGNDWRSVKKCYYPHALSPSKAICSNNNVSICNVSVFLKIREELGEKNLHNFPFNGNICRNHSRLIAASIENDVQINYIPFEYELRVDDNNDLKYLLNIIKSEENVHKIKKPIHELGKRSINEIKRSFKKICESFQKTLISYWAPNQAEELSNLIFSPVPDTINDQRSNILSAYGEAYKQNNDLNSKLLILSVMGKSEYNYTQTEIMQTCEGSTLYLVKKSAQIYKTREESVENKITSNIRLDERKVRHFLSHLYTTGSLVQLAHGTSRFSYSSGIKVIVAQSILTGLKAHVIDDYLTFCKEIDFPHLSKNTLFNILKTIKPSKKKAMAGMDNIEVEGLKGFETLKSLIENYSTSEKIPLLKYLLSEAKRYIKNGYLPHIKRESECLSHCGQFGTSDSSKSDRNVGTRTRKFVKNVSKFLNFLKN
jgi:CII-binding regulator of phage lambda lysogenization HflD